MKQVANRQCLKFRAADFQQVWVESNYYFQCNKCGERFKDDK